MEVVDRVKEVTDPLRRRSLRLDVVLMALGMMALPLLILVGWSWLEGDIRGVLSESAREAAVETAEVLESSAANRVSAGDRDDWLEGIAVRHTARIRVFDPDGSLAMEIDRDRGDDPIQHVGTWFLGPDGAPSLVAYDQTLPPVLERPEVAASSEGANGCRTSPGDKLLVCHAVASVKIGEKDQTIYVQESSRRAVRKIYDLRYHLSRLTLAMLPFALLFSWWMGRRMVRPIDELRKHVLEKTQSASAEADLVVSRDEELGELTEALNGLLKSLDDRKRADESFAADLVHEFKNPVAAVQACAESLEAGAVDEQRAARLGKVLRASSARLDLLVSQFLDLARAEAGMPHEERVDVDLGQLVEGIASDMGQQQPGVVIQVEAAAGRSGGVAVVRGVPHRLDSVVRNLIDNAIAATLSVGQVPGVAPIVVRVGSGAFGVRLDVIDRGPGIAKNDLPHVFQRFFSTRAATGQDAPVRGTGLGLALVKAIAEAHGATVGVTSTRGEGATFTVVFPPADETPA